MNVLADLAAAFEPSPARPFLDIDGISLTRSEFLSAAAYRQQQFRNGGVIQGTRVVTPVGRGVWSWIDMVALWAIGAVPAPVNPKDAPAVLATVNEIIEPTHTIEERFEGAPAGCVLLPGAPAIEDAIAVDASPEIAPMDDGSLALILFTSGSTGRPKGVALSHIALRDNARATAKRIDLRETDRLCTAIPARFVSAVSHFIVTGYCGAALTGTERPLVGRELTELIVQRNATCFGGSPLQVGWVGANPDTMGRQLRWVFSSGDKLDPRVIESFRQALPDVGIYTVYGLTEIGGRFCILTPDQLDANIGAVGRPIEGLQAIIRDDEGALLPAGEAGEVYVRGPHLMDGYYRDEAATGRAIINGEFRTGDLGTLDENEILRLEGRSNDVFKCAGQKVSGPLILEHIVNLGVFAECAVSSMDDATLGQVPVVLYRLADGADWNRGSVLRALRQSLPSNHIPRRFIAVDAIPRTSSGKVDRGAVRRLLTEHSAS